MLLLHIFFFDKAPNTPVAKVLTSETHDATKKLGEFSPTGYVILHETRDSILQKLYILGPTIRVEIVK